jgi:thiol:disulfide interchange protein
MTWCLAMSFTQVYIFFTAIAVGMASPYLVIGAFPKLIKSLPKPGAWMETVKQVMGFVLLATVIWLFMSISWSIMVPLLAFMFALWGACWWIGRVPLTAERPVRLRAWIGAAVFATLIGLFAFSPGITVGGYPIPGLAGVMQHRLDSELQGKIEKRVAEEKKKILERALEAIAAADPNGSGNGAAPELTADALLAEGENSDEESKPENEYDLPWQRFSLAKLKRLTADNKTVMIDFTADWCATCKTLKQFVLNTQAVREVVDRNGVIPLHANWSNNEDVGPMLNALNSRQVPVLAIFPAGNANDPIVISGPYKQSTLISKLEEAGPSVEPPDETRAAMRVP